MWRWTRRILVGLCTLVIVAAVAGATYQWLATRRDLATARPPGRLIDVGGHRLHIWCVGSGAPTVVLEAGLGGSSAVWGFVQPEVARFTRVCSYDRAGMGYSDPGPSPRTARRLAHDLAVLLERTGITEPAVLVGASIGGFPVRIFASERASRVAGVVLVDATHEARMDPVPRLAVFVPILSSLGVLRLMGISFGLPPNSLPLSVRGYAHATRFRASGHNAAADEIVHARESAEEVRATRRKLTVPLVVVTGGRGSDSVWQQLQRDLVELSQHGCLITAAESGHVVELDQPDVVVDAIRATVNAVRANGVAPCR